MSSSVFIESSSQPVDTRDYPSTTDSNLVVVYGKNGISFDDKGLESLIDEKQISSISVIRLTSPTPSMREEEEEAEKLEELLRRQEIGSDKDSVDSEDEDGSSNIEETAENCDSSNEEDSEKRKVLRESNNESSEEDKSKQRRQPRRRGRQPNVVKQKKVLRRRRLDRPEIVGLHLEEFYPPEDASEIIKEALRIAGLKSDKKNRSDYDFQLLVIQNDHCYTPFTSPTQMKAKLEADKIEAEKQAANRKSGILQKTVSKQLFVRKKLSQNIHSKSENVIKITTKDKNVLVAHKIKKEIKDRKATSDDEDVHSSIDENEVDEGGENESDFSGSDYSMESDNDRDSDLDFDVNNPKGRKRKPKVMKTHKRSLSVSKVNPKSRLYYGQDDSNELTNRPPATSNISSVVQRQKSVIKVISDPARVTVRSTPSKVTHMMGQTNTLSPVIAALPPIPKKQNENKTLLNMNTTAAVTMPPKTYVMKCPMEQKSAVKSTPQTHKEILINKQIVSSPKTKGFTDLTKLIEQTEKQPNVKTIGSTTIKSSHTATITSVVTFSPTSTSASLLRGFMPIETTAKNPLPAQISIQTHQSSTELEAEHDKQLDLINSIVQDEMQKSNEKEDGQITNISENIPELVKMLESTEKVLVAANTQHGSTSKSQDVSHLVSDRSISGGIKNGNVGIASNQNIFNLPSIAPSSSANNLVGEIDITSASLLATPEGESDVTDDLPDDILQQVVELIKDDKTLQEAVENQVFGTSVSSNPGMVNNVIINHNPPPLAPISQQHVRIQENPQTPSKSIIQLAISNVPPSLVSPPASNQSNATNSSRPTTSTPTTGTTTEQTSYQTPKTSPIVRKEPIQIIRGNGRVITLPPIEAPTTRAKRRAQAQPNPNITAQGNSSFLPIAALSESSLDSSIHSNSSLNAGVLQEKKIDSNKRRRGSRENTTSGAAASNQKTIKTQKASAKKGGNKSNANKGKVETDQTESENDDDDPNKLWCICRQPHNNRFMICCDVCEDWFHGTCVSVTKAMGIEMEQKGIDWTCPKCIKKQEEKKQPKITEMLIKKTPENISGQIDPVANSFTLTPTLDSSATLQKTPTTKVTPGSIDIINITSKKELNTPNLETASHLKLQSGQIINLKDFNTTSSKRATIIQTSTSNTNTNPITPGQKKLYVTSGQANLKMSSQPGTPIRTITVVKQLTTPQQHHNQTEKVIKTLCPVTTSTPQSVNTVTSVAVSPAASVPASTPVTTTSITRLTENSTLCIVCKKVARSNSIYCSDDCIRKHAQNALNSLMNKSQTDSGVTVSAANKSITEDKTKKKSKCLFEEVLSAADRKPKVERVNVFERKSGRIITGNSAPTVANLKKWLQDNPTFEVIQPGSTQAIDLEKKQKQLRTQNSSSPTIIKSATSSPPPLKMFSLTSNKMDPGIGSSPPQAQPPQIPTKSNKPIIDYVKNTNSNPASPRPNTPRQLHKYPQNVGIKPDKIPKMPEDPKPVVKEKTSSTKRQASAESGNKNSNNDGEPIRLVVRRTLKEQLLIRIKEELSSSSSTTTGESDETPKVNNVPKLTEEEVEEFAKSTELEMYNYFNRDTGIKYKAKYRSLVFNIKDRKNRTLFAKICGKLIEPRRLVRMSPEELASQELAQWREQENKHQLEMIKKSELDLLACAKNYVLKTHKGEEVIEGKTTDYANVDITIPVEDVVSAINKSDLPDASGLTRKEPPAHWSDADTTTVSHSHSILAETSHLSIEEDKLQIKSSQSKERDREREKEKDKDRERERDKEKTKGRDREREKRHKSKDRHHDKLRSRKRSHSNSRSRSREKSEKRHKSSHKEEKRDRDERNRADKERVKDRTEREYHNEGNEKKYLTSSESKKSTVTQPRQSGKKFHEHQKASINPLETYNLIDQILESTKTVEEAANLTTERDKEKDTERECKTAATPMPIQSATSTVSTTTSNIDSVSVPGIPINIGSSESDQEPTSTVSIPTPPHDPYSRFIACSSPSSFSGDPPYSIVSLWTGSINMVDVTCFQLSIQPIVGNLTCLVKLFPKELDVVGRIGPETVWDYISKIKKSPNKEIVVIRLIPANESETVAYKTLYEYLDNRNRLGVIKSTSSQIKDFYIYPLAAGKSVPTLLQPSEPVDFYDDPYRPDVLIGIIVRVVVSKRIISSTTQASTSTAVNKLSSRSSDIDTFTPPGSPKPKKHRPKVGEIDIDAIIKAPIASKAQKTMPAPLPKSKDIDADEPYSPGGSSDDDLPILPVKMSHSVDHMQVAEDELKRKMEEINRQIAAQEMEIAGLLTGESATFGSATAPTSTVLANISIPSNLSQILASIKTTRKDQSVVPPPPPLISSLLKSSTSASATQSDENKYNIGNSTTGSTYETRNTGTGSNTRSTSLLAKLSEAELLSMVPDDIVITAPSKPSRYEEPPPPGV